MWHSRVSHLYSYAVQKSTLHNFIKKKKERKIRGLGFFLAFVEHIFAGYLLRRMRLGDEGVRKVTENPFKCASEWRIQDFQTPWSLHKGYTTEDFLICIVLIHVSLWMIPPFLMSQSIWPTVNETDQYAVCYVCAVSVCMCVCGPGWTDVLLNIDRDERRTTKLLPINSMPDEIEGNMSKLVILPFIVWTPVKNLCFLTPYLLR